MNVENNLSRHKCIVCGRVFPRGQGLVIKLGEEILEFHSSRCFSKFARSLLERIPSSEIRGYIKRIREEYEEYIQQKQKHRLKKIT